MTEKMGVDHYETLGIPDTADESEIKKAYRQRSREVHPDKNPGISDEPMKKLNEARDVLLDSSKRKDFDRKRREEMQKRGGGVSGGRVHKEKDKKTPPGTFFKNKGAPGSAYSEFKNFAQGAKGFKEYTQRSRYDFSFGRKANDKKETPNSAGNAQSNANQSSSGPEAKDKTETPNSAGNAQSNANQFSSGNERSTQYNFPSSGDANDTKDDPNFRGEARSSPYNFSSDQGAKDKKESPNFADYAKRSKYDFSFRPGHKSNENTSKFAGHAQRSKYNFSFGNSNAENKKETPKFSGEKNDFFNFTGSTQKEEKKSGFGAESGHQEDLPHKKPFGREDTSTFGVDSTTNEPHVHEVFLTLEDVAKGCIKDMHFWRPIKLADGTSGKEKMVLSFEVKKGWKAGSKVTFGKAVQTWKNAERDIVFIMRDAPHPIFTRDGSDLLYTAKVSAAQIELGSPIDIPTLDGGKKSLIITPDFVDDPNLLKRVKGEGLPFPKEPTKKGDLIVKFVSAS